MTPLLSEVYPLEVESKMRNVFDSLSEKDRRRYAAAEAVKLGRGGIAYIARLFGCGRNRIEHGIRELDQLPDDPVGDRIRRPGAGRPKAEEKHPDMVENVRQTIKNRTAGDPMRDDVLWTGLTPREIAEHLERGHRQEVQSENCQADPEFPRLWSAEDREGAARQRVAIPRRAVRPHRSTEG